MSTVNNDDLLQINRSGTSYKSTAEDFATYVGSKSNVNEFVATGTIPNGKPVVINSDGTVSVASDEPDLGPDVAFGTGASRYYSAIYDSTNQKVVIAYEDSSNSEKGTAVVGNVSGNSISFGTPVVFETGGVLHQSATYDSTSQKVVIAYQDYGDSDKGKAVVGTVSGTSISFGTSTTFRNSASWTAATYDSTNNKVVIAYRDNNTAQRGAAIVGTVIGTSIIFGSSVEFESDPADYISATYDSTNQKVVIAYSDVGNSNYGTAVVGNVSGTGNSISFGTPVVFETSDTQDFSATYDSTNSKVVIAYRDGGDSDKGKAVVGTVSGTSISFGTPVVYETGVTQYLSAGYDPTNNKVVIAYRDNSNSDYGTAVLGTVSGSLISFDTPFIFETNNTQHCSVTYDSTNQKVVLVYRDADNSNYGEAIVMDIPDLSETYIGLAAEAISDGATGKVTTAGGVNSSQTGLATARTYYVQGDGSIGLTADFQSVVAGTSISSTNIIVK